MREGSKAGVMGCRSPTKNISGGLPISLTLMYVITLGKSYPDPGMTAYPGRYGEGQAFQYPLAIVRSTDLLEAFQVEVSANLDRLFPSVVPNIIVTESGYAEIRAFTR